MVVHCGEQPRESDARAFGVMKAVVRSSFKSTFMAEAATPKALKRCGEHENHDQAKTE